MKSYYILKLKLTPLQVDMLQEILSEGITGVQQHLDGVEENRLLTVESKVYEAINASGYEQDTSDAGILVSDMPDDRKEWFREFCEQLK